MTATKRHLAIIDIYETAEYIAQDDLEIAIRFTNAVEESIDFIKRTPKIGTLQNIKGHQGIRMWFVQDFPKVLIFYYERPEEIEVARVIHSARDFYRVFRKK